MHWRLSQDSRHFFGYCLNEKRHGMRAQEAVFVRA
jgi:hypothetical protein